MKPQTEYSRLLGYSVNYLSQYKYTRHLPKETSASEVKRLCDTEKEEQEAIINSCIDMYYDLKERKKLHAFSRHLVALGLYNHDRSFMTTIKRYFYSTYGLRNRHYIEEQRRVLKAYREFEWVT